VTGDDDTSDIKDQDLLKEAAEALKVDPEDLAKAICHETVPIPGREDAVKNKSKKQALCGSYYETL